MNTSEQTPQLLRFLRERRDAVVDRWHDAIVHTGFTSLTTEEIRRRLGDLTDQAIVLLLSEPFERSKAREIGSALASMHYLSADTLSGTQEVLARQLVEDLPADEAAALHPRLARLLAEVGAGFFGQTRDTILLEQEQTKAAHLKERKKVQEAMRKNEAMLAEAQRIAHLGELRIRERTAELTRANKELRAEIAERKQAEEEIRLQAHLLDAVGQAVVATDLEGRITYWNPSAQDLYGWSAEEVIGRSVMQIIPSETQLERAEEIISELRAGRSWSGELEVKRKDGTSFPVIVTCTPVHDERGNLVGITGISTDITERKRIEEALLQSERLYRTVVEQAAENIFLVDAETKRILEANTTLHQSLNYSAEELRQMTLYDIVAHDRESIDRNARRVMEEGHLLVGERSYRRKDGSLVAVEVNVSTISHKGRETLCIVAHDVTEYKQAEESLRRSLGMLLALREAGQVLGSTLESEEVVSRLLEIMRRVSNLTTTVISVLDEDGRVRIWRSVGLEGLWERARFARQALDARQAVLETEEHQLFPLQRPGSETAHLVGLYLPLRTRERVIGVLEAYGPEALAESDTVEVLASLASQAASALENARLYGELGEREHRLQDLVGRLLGAQEEEQRRVAYEVHDGLAQVAAAAHQHLQAFARRHPPSGERSRRDLERVLRLVRQTVSEARRIIGNLRPTTLDDLGLVATISMEVERLREEDYEIEYKEELGDERLPATMEIALFRVVQEALTNIQKHAHTRRVRIELRHQEEEVHLEVQDYGTGFNPAVASTGGGPGERVGLAGMRERVGMLGGKLKIHSRPGVGTSVIVEVPLPATKVEASISTSIT